MKNSLPCDVPPDKVGEHVGHDIRECSQTPKDAQQQKVDSMVSKTIKTLSQNISSVNDFIMELYTVKPTVDEYNHQTNQEFADISDNIKQ